MERAESTRTSAPSRSSRKSLTLLTPLRHGAFRLLFAGQVISNLGDWLDLLALLALIVYQWRLGAEALASLTLMMLLPGAFIAPVVGVLVDRLPRRRVMIACDLGRAILAASLIWAPNIFFVVGVVLAMASMSAFFEPARQAAIRLTVPEADLLSANALGRLSSTTTKVLGPAIGGLILAMGGPRAAFFADALSFVLSAALLMFLRLSEEASEASAQRGSEPRHRLGAYLRSLLDDFRSGWMYILGAPLLALAIGAQMGEMLLVESTDSFSVLAFKGLGVSEALIGAAIGCSGLGNVVCALAIGQWGQRINPLREMGLGNLLVGVCSAALGVGVMLDVGGSVGWFPVLVLAGAGFAALWIPYSYIVQRETEDSYMGRVTATSSALYTPLGLVGIGLGTFLVQRIGVGPLFAVSGGALALLGVFLLLVRLPQKAVREMDGGG